MNVDSYEAACAAATTSQGLDPMIECLTTEGIEHRLQQTGGFCMVVEVPLGTVGEAYIGVTRADDVEPDGEPRWLLMHYPDDYAVADDTATVLYETLTTEQTVVTLYAHGARGLR